MSPASVTSSPMRPFFVYMLRCNDGSFYVGHTDDLEHRMQQHQAGLIPGYTQSRHPLELVWFHETELRIDAIELELKVKDWSRAKKKALIRGDWDEIRRLSKGKQTRVRSAGPSLRAACGRAPLGANGGNDTTG